MGENFKVLVKKGSQSLEVVPSGRFKVNDMLAAKEAAISGLGLVFLPSLIATDGV